MKPNRWLLGLSLLALLWASGVATQVDAAAEQLGQVQFTTSCQPAVQAQFNRAVALLHSFSFDASAKAFEEVAQQDPNCAMAHWGVAMTWLGNPFGWPPSPKALQEGWAAVERAKAIGAKTPREQAYISAVEAFYKDADKIDHRTRALSYARMLEHLHTTYPDDREAAIFYALALNATAVPTDKTYANQLKAAAILEDIFNEQPNHPGVAHYLIHSYDYPSIAEKGLPAARRYADIAPAAPHALHMPSHIFTRRGFWQESIDSNRASAAAAKNQFDQLHAMDYLIYAHLQLGQDAAARRVFEDMNAIEKVTFEHFVTAYAMAAIPSRYALERRQWAEASALTLPKADFPWNRFPQAEAVLVFARALGAARSGNVEAARKDIERLQTLREALATAKLSYWVEQVDIQHQVATAWVMWAQGQREEALQTMRAAADREDGTEKHPVTPGPIVPARELLGEMLLAANQPQLALQAFEASMQIEPNRFWGLYGAAQAAELAGDRAKAKTYYAQLIALGERADSERPALVQAKAFVGRQ